jgi:tetratricopeptide (TPR) repeat protein
VELIDFRAKKKEAWELTTEEKVAEATQGKDRGTALFKEKRFEEAVRAYEEAAEAVEQVKDAEAVWIACKLNAAQCAINLADYPSAVAYAGAALKRDPRNVKALYRRGLARNHLGLPEEALVDLHAALALDPDNVAARTEVAAAKRRIAEAGRKERAAYGNMFKKISVYDDKAAAAPDSGTNPQASLI